MNIKESCKCPACSSRLVFDIRQSALRCPGCDASYDTEKFDEDLLSKHPPRNDGKDAAPDPAVRYCTNCGAGLYPGAQSFTENCPCCNNPVRGASRSANGVTPDLAIPFAYGREYLLKALRDSCGDDPIVKDGFLEKISPESVRPVYLPFLIYDLKAVADLSVKIWNSGESYVKDRGFDLDLTAFPELLHDLPVQDSSQKNPLAGCWYDKWKLADVQPLRKAWFGELRDKYGAVSPPEVLDPRTAPDFEVIKARILQKCVRQMAGSKRHKILFRKIGITPGSIRYVLCPAWLLSVTLEGKTYLSVMNASNRSDIILSVPRSLLRRIVTALAFASTAPGFLRLPISP